MYFTSSEMTKRFDTLLEKAGGEVEAREVRALVAVHASYYDTKGPRCSEVNEVKWHLLLPKLRLELRRWCHTSAATTSPADLTLKRELIEFLGESA